MTSKKRRKPNPWKQVGYSTGLVMQSGTLMSINQARQVIANKPQGFAQGGIVMASSQGVQVNINAGSIATQKITLFKRPPEPKPCGARRGGPDSKVFCEIWETVEHKSHMGRGRNRWYSWV